MKRSELGTHERPGRAAGTKEVSPAGTKAEGPVGFSPTDQGPDSA